MALLHPSRRRNTEHSIREVMIDLKKRRGSETLVNGAKRSVLSLERGVGQVGGKATLNPGHWSIADAGVPSYYSKQTQWPMVESALKSQPT